MDSLPSLFDSLAGYPRWFVALCLTIVVAALVWILAKLLKWTLWLVLAAVLLVGGAAAVWLLVKS